ncbi:MAG: hypothetical protein LBB26_02320 [Puniceicoccales bacterium]|nr:hypothetical protein [Puniceicoccales bacterium]
MRIPKIGEAITGAAIAVDIPECIRVKSVAVAARVFFGKYLAFLGYSKAIERTQRPMQVPERKTKTKPLVSKAVPMATAASVIFAREIDFPTSAPAHRTRNTWGTSPAGVISSGRGSCVCPVIFIELPRGVS